jgi:hypothetical protein
VTEVTTTWRSPSLTAAMATRSGSPGSGEEGFPEAMLQNTQFLVQVSPRIRKVAVPRE